MQKKTIEFNPVCPINLESKISRCGNVPLLDPRYYLKSSTKQLTFEDAENRLDKAITYWKSKVNEYKELLDKGEIKETVLWENIDHLQGLQTARMHLQLEREGKDWY